MSEKDEGAQCFLDVRTHTSPKLQAGFFLSIVNGHFSVLEGHTLILFPFVFFLLNT